MFAENLTETLLRVLERPELKVLAQFCCITLNPSIGHPFQVNRQGDITLGAPCLGEETVVAFHLRHALELAVLLKKTSESQRETTRIILAAARTTARFWLLDSCADQPPPEAWVRVFSAADVPTKAALKAVYPVFQPLVAEAGGHEQRPLSSGEWDEIFDWLVKAWSLIGPVEALMAEGGDARLSVGVRTGLNHYGCSHRPRPWAVTFASSTASSLSERGFTGGELARLALMRAVLQGNAHTFLKQKARDIRGYLAGFFGLVDSDAVILSPSGTDSALAVLAFSAACNKPVTTVLTAPDETGSGVPFAAQGCHFAQETARSVLVEKGSLVDGFPADTRCLTLPLRNVEGGLRLSDDVVHSCQVMVAEEVAAGRRVLLHVLDLSKTGLLAPDMEAIAALCAAYPGCLDVVVDACQTRLMPQRVKTYLDREWAVMVTGSKFYTGPPFCGALLLPDSWKKRLAHGGLPAGLAAYANQCEWPSSPACQVLASGANHGLLLRWSAARAEMEAFAAIPADVVSERLHSFLHAVTQAILTQPDLQLLTPYVPQRPILPDDWDRRQTILSFMVRAPEAPDIDTPLDFDRCRKLYQWLNADVSDYVPLVDRKLGALLCHVGQPVALPHPHARGGKAAALRLSAGARLISGEPSHDGLGTKARMAREIADARKVLEKISLILAHWSAIATADPLPSYAPKFSMGFPALGADGSSCHHGNGGGSQQAGITISSLALGRS
ncbi:hypothetical protein [Acetobacter tropicalis]|uniref:GMP reductase n=1 Tax=Acetobacter tropicalis TaxID=104102 RepID=A0A511FK69_9PROT|nr:hypothetical protein [Acetobacter tropicalis]GEL49600.1 hypothetical protein ATR01nite_06750 [Acetobacter tropicalis]